MRKVTLPANFNKYNFAELAKKEKNQALKVRYTAFYYIQLQIPVTEVAKLTFKTNRMIHRWLNRFDEFGIDGLKDKAGRGRKHILSDEQINDLAEVLKNTTHINAIAVKKIINKAYNLDLTLPTVYNIIKRTGIDSIKRKGI